MISCFFLLIISSCNYYGKKSSEIVKSDKFVDVGTHKLRVILSDISSKYTIILESGGGQYSEVYKEMQDTLAKLTGITIMSYDRSGFGQSELGPDTFNAIDEVDALKRCLDVQGFKNNYILVGHSYGGFLAQLFTFRYPELVKGIVLIDPMNVKFVDRFGLDSINAVTPYFNNPTTDYEKSVNRMVDYFPISLEILRGYELPTDKPVLLITSGNPPFSSNIWSKCHEEMMMNSKNHKLIMAKENTHNMIAENPELILNTITELSKRIK